MFIDISHWNGKFDWNKAVANGVDGAYIKASQGTYILDDKFKENSAACPLKYKGAYHFLDYCKTHYSSGQEISFGQKQADWFVKCMGDWKYTLPGALDIETNAAWEKIDALSAGRVLKIALAFKNRYYVLTGHNPAIYCSPYLTQWMQNFLDCPLWIAHYDVAAPKFYKWDKCALWQYSSTGDGLLYGNATGNKYIDLNKIGTPIDQWAINVTQENEDSQPSEVTDTEKLNRLWQAHPELH